MTKVFVVMKSSRGGSVSPLAVFSTEKRAEQEIEALEGKMTYMQLTGDYTFWFDEVEMDRTFTTWREVPF
jgi:hypothetical protein